MFIVHLIRLPFTLNSVQARNLEAIGMRLSWATIAPQPIEPNELENFNLKKRSLKAAKLILFHSVVALTSWLNIALTVIALLEWCFLIATTPREIRAAQWRMKHIRYTAEDFIHQLFIVSGLPESRREEWITEQMNEVKQRLDDLAEGQLHLALRNYWAEIETILGPGSRRLAECEPFFDQCWDKKITLYELKRKISDLLNTQMAV